MSWAVLIQLILQFGPPALDLAQKLISKWNSTDPVTAADIEELKRLGQRTPRQALIDALNRAGVPLDSPQAIALLAAIPV